MNTISYRNDWMQHIYKVNNETVTPNKVSVSRCGKFYGVFEVIKVIETGSYMDMGHKYPYETTQCYVSIDSVFGTVKGPSLSELISLGYDIILEV